MKRSWMLEVVLEAIQMSEGKQWRRDTAERVVKAMEEEGFEFEPEPPEWPELSVHRTSNAGHHGLHAGDGSRSEGEASRIAKAWSVRRPGGEMERRLRKVRDGYPEGSPGYDAIEAALRLGVEEGS